MSDKGLKLSSDLIVMGREPMPEFSPEDVRAWLVLHQDENGTNRCSEVIYGTKWLL